MGINRNSPVPITDQIAADLRHGIADGTLAGRLPAYKALATRYGVAEMTIQSVMKELQREGLVTTVTGRGTFVSEPEGSAAVAATGEDLSALRKDVDEMRGRLDALERAVGTGGV